MTHRARPLQVRDFSLFDAILVMDDNNYDTVCRMAPDAEAREKVLRTADFLTGEYATKSTIPDPYYGDMADFEYVLDLLENATDEFLRRLTTCS
jgi:protein-tyrosine phosphatase